MSAPMVHVVRLSGCRSRPLGGYLKALGLHRLIAEQADRAARTAWEGDCLVLHSTLDEAAVCRFLSEDYRPTPVISPWNGGSGFYPKDNQDGIGPMAASTGPRFAAYREAIAVARELMARIGALTKGGLEKSVLLEHLRAELPDAALAWLDAAVLLTPGDPKFPPLLGTGGNDGRLDFSNNFMQRLVELEAEQPAVRARLLQQALFGTPTPGLTDAAVGQFNPGSAGGYNTGFGFDGAARVNPWDFVLLMEGALCFAAAAVRKLETGGAADLVFPFMVRAAGAGYASAGEADEEKSRQELWLPLWSSPVPWRSLRQLLSEGRALVSSGGGNRPATNALDFARAVGELGVDRGLSAFERYGFHVRNGLSYLAVPLGRWAVEPNAGATRLAELDQWIPRFRKAAGGDRAPAAVGRLRRRLDDRILDLCAHDSAGARLDLLVVLGAIDRQLGRSVTWARDPAVAVPPVPWLDREWLPDAAEETIEGRLARALAAGGLRGRASPVEETEGKRPRLVWRERSDVGMVWTAEPLLANLESLVLRREIERSAQSREQAIDALGTAPVELADLASFLRGEVDEVRVAELALAYALIRPTAIPRCSAHGRAPLPPLYPLLALAHDPRAVPRGGGVVAVELPPVPGLLRRALAGQAEPASRLALRRLRASGIPAAAFNHRRLGSRDTGLTDTPAATRRAALALVFPLSDAARQTLADSILVSPELP